MQGQLNVVSHLYLQRIESQAFAVVFWIDALQLFLHASQVNVAEIFPEK